MKNRGLIPKLAIGTLVVACSVLLAFFFFPSVNSQSNLVAPDGSTPNNSYPQNSASNGASSSASSHEIDPVVSEDGSVIITGEHQTDVVLVMLESGADPAQITTALASQSCLDMSSTTITSKDVADGFAAVPLAQDYNVADAIAVLKNVDGVSGSQPNYYYHLLDAVESENGESATASDSSMPQAAASLDAQDDVNDTYGKQSASSSYNWHLSSIHAYEAWSKVKGENLGDGRVTVAVIDSGYDVDHEDLSAGSESGIGGNVIAAYDATKNSRENINNGNGSGVGDITGHGTHVAGIVSGVANNGKGIAGVSYNANVLPIQVFHEYTKSDNTTDYTASTVSIYYAYSYIISNASSYNIRVANMSLGAKQSGSLDADDSLLINTIEQAYDKGILTICAAGNENTSDSYYPVDYLRHGMGVIAINSNLERADYSNYNSSSALKTKDISAPGTSIYSTTYNGAYGWKSGTSMASPVVAGVAALVFTADPEASPGDVINIIHETASDIIYTKDGEVAGEGFDQYTGYGEINALAAVEKAGGYLSGDATMLKGTTISLTSTVTPSSGAWTWSSSDESVATVSNGEVTAVSGGTTTITATSGSLELTKDITVFDIWYSVEDDPEVAVDEAEIEAFDTLNLIFNENPDTGMWYIGSSDTSVATVSVPGTGPIVVTGKSAGEATISATLQENPSLVVSIKVTVCDSSSKRSLESSRAKVYWSQMAAFFGMGGGSIGNKSYTGFSIEPSPYAVTYTTGNGRSKTTTALVLGRDYEMSYEANKDVGTATATVTGIGSYEGAISSTFTISQTSLASVTAYDLDSVRYTGSPLEPEPRLVLSTSSGDYTLIKGTDYSIDSYENNTEISSNTTDGYARVYVTGLGNFTGSGYYRFYIKPISIASATVSAQGWNYDGATHSPSVSVKLDGQNLPQSGNWSYTITKDGKAVEANAIRDAGTYTVTVTGEGNYEGTASTTFTVVQRSIAGASVQLSASTLTYNGSAQQPSVSSVTLRDGTVLSSSDYSVTYSNNMNVGTATATVTGTGNYKGSANASFSITKRSINGATVKLSSYSYTYTGSAKTPTVVSVTLPNGTSLTSSDYSVSYSNNVKVGTATATVTGTGGNTGSASVNFTIVAAPDSDTRSMHRLYNPNSGEHFYTSDDEERDSLVNAGWRSEGDGWRAPKWSNTPVYRMYNPNAGEHHYTPDISERNALVAAGWRDEGIGWYSDDNHTVPLYRDYNPNAYANNHNYTTDANEHRWLLSIGWRDEGYAWYGM